MKKLFKKLGFVLIGILSVLIDTILIVVGVGIVGTLVLVAAPIASLIGTTILVKDRLRLVR